MRMEKCTRCGVVWNVSVHLHIPGVYVCLACEDKQSRMFARMRRKVAYDEAHKAKRIARYHG